MKAPRKSQTVSREGRFTAFAAALKRIETETTDRGHRVTRDAVAEEVGVAKSAVSAWFSGIQIPRTRYLELLADFFAFGDDELRASHRLTLFDAANVPLSESSASTAMVRARERSGIIRIGVCIYDKPFEDFFKEVMRAFGNFCAFHLEIRTVAFADLSTEIEQGKIDLGANYFATPDRLQKLRFITTPLTVGLNAVTFAIGRDALRPFPGAEPDLRRARPIVNEAEASYRYARHVLDVKRSDIVTCEYDPELLAKQLEFRFGQWLDDQERPENQRQGIQVPVIITDELMCLKTHVALIDRLLTNRSSRITLANSGPSVLVLSSDIKRSASSSSVATNPHYNLSLCVLRQKDREWFEYISDAWDIFLDSNNQFLAEKYHALQSELTGLLNELRTTITADRDKLSNGWGDGLSAGELDNALYSDWENLLETWLRNDQGHSWERIVKQALSSPSVDSDDQNSQTPLALLAQIKSNLDALEPIVRRVLLERRTPSID